MSTNRYIPPDPLAGGSTNQPQQNQQNGYQQPQQPAQQNRPAASGTYTIGSPRGAQIAGMLQNGQSTNDLGVEWRPGDQSVWWKDANGQLYVDHQGQTMYGNVTYQAPAQNNYNQQSGTASGSYTIGSPRGNEIASMLQPGMSTNDLPAEYRPGDQSVWMRDAQGNLYIHHQGNLMKGVVTYQAPQQQQHPQQQQTEYQPITTTPIVPGQSAITRPSQSENRLTADDIKAVYQQMQDQQNQKIDYTVKQAVDELTRAQEDAQKGFTSQRNQINIDEAQARDAQVLYAAARGDRGGITGRQYNSISNTAANNRAAVAEAQQKLATDTARQIADLRAQGEFEKADALLQIAQQQLAQLWELQKYNDNLSLQEQQLLMQESQLTGSYNGKPTLDVQLADREYNYNTQAAEREWQQALKEWDYTTAQNEREWAYQIAMQSIQAGVTPDASTLAAAGISQSMASQLASVYKATLAAKGSSSGGGGTQPTKGKAPSVNDYVYESANTMYNNGMSENDIWNYLVGEVGEDTAKTYAGFLGMDIARDTSGYFVTNEQREGSIIVDGYGRMTWQRVLENVQSGSVIEDIDHERQTITYRRNYDYKPNK